MGSKKIILAVRMRLLLQVGAVIPVWPTLFSGLASFALARPAALVVVLHDPVKVNRGLPKNHEDNYLVK